MGWYICLKGIMSKEDAKRAIDIGADAIMISNHGGRQLDGSASPFDQLEEIADYVSGKIDLSVMVELEGELICSKLFL